MTDKQREKVTKRTALDRRSFMKGVGGGVVTTGTLASGITTVSKRESAAVESGTMIGPDTVLITLSVNGTVYETAAEPRETLLEVLRNRLEITGPKIICNRGSCGGCTVWLDGKPVYSCMMIAIEAEGREITTIEALSADGTLHPVQQAFIEEDALQCGFCTPGFVMSMAATLEENTTASLDEIKTGIAGHVCRCGSYTNIFNAAENAKRKMGG